MFELPERQRGLGKILAPVIRKKKGNTRASQKIQKDGYVRVRDGEACADQRDVEEQATQYRCQVDRIVIKGGHS